MSFFKEKLSGFTVSFISSLTLYNLSKNLLDRYHIKSRLISNHKFNEKKNINKIITKIPEADIIAPKITSLRDKSNQNPFRVDNDIKLIENIFWKL